MRSSSLHAYSHRETPSVEPRRSSTNSTSPTRTLDLRLRGNNSNSSSPNGNLGARRSRDLAPLSNVNHGVNLRNPPSSIHYNSSASPSIREVESEGGSNSSMSRSPIWARRNSLKRDSQEGTPTGRPPMSNSSFTGGNSSTSSAIASSLTQAGSAGAMMPPVRHRSSSNNSRTGATPGKSAPATILPVNEGDSGDSSDTEGMGLSSSLVRAGASTTASSWEAPKNLTVAQKTKLRKVKSQGFNLSPCRGLNESMLPPPTIANSNKKLLVLDIDETLVHASFTPDAKHDVRITITVGNETGHIYVAFRPHMKTFLRAVAPLFEISIFTASQSCYAQQLMDHIDPGQRLLGPHRLFREHCTEVNGARVKDLSLLGRPLEKIAIVDNSPVAYLFQPRNAIPIISWFDDPSDTELLKLIPFLKQLAEEPKVYDMLDYMNAGLV